MCRHVRIGNRMGEVPTWDPVSGMTVRTHDSTLDGLSPKILDKALPEWQASSKPCDGECVKYYFTPESLLKGILCLALIISSRVLEYVCLEHFREDKDAPVTPIRQSLSKLMPEFMSDLLVALLSRCPLSCSITGPECKNARNVEMKPKVWSRLPTELLSTIITKLPLQNILQLRSVCKEWRDLACNHSCLDSSFALPSRLPSPVEASTVSYPPICICLLRNNQCGVYNPTSNAWSVLPHSFIPKYYSVVPFHRILVANAGSLLLLRGGEHGSRYFFVVNPVNKSVRKLVALPQPRPEVFKNIGLAALFECDAWIAVSKKTGDFRVVSNEEYLVDRRGVQPYKSIHFLSVFDSRSDCWTLKCAAMQHLQTKRIRQVFLFRDQLLCLVERRLLGFPLFPPNRFEVYRVSDDGCSQQDTYLNLANMMRLERWPYEVYYLQQKGWERRAYDLPKNISGAKLFECEGILMLVAGITEPRKMLLRGNSCMLAMHIWMFSPGREPGRYEWVRFQTMPKELLAHVSSSDPRFNNLNDSQHYSIQINGTYVAVNNFDTARTVMCNVSTKIWWLLPPKSTEVLRALPDHETYISSFLLEPSLEVP